jgi:hypothetical protein
MPKKTKAVRLTGAQLEALLTFSASPEKITTALWHLRARTEPTTLNDRTDALVALLLQPEPYESMQLVLSQGENEISQLVAALPETPPDETAEPELAAEDLPPELDEREQLNEIWAMHRETLMIILDTPDSAATSKIAKAWMKTAAKIGDALASGVQADDDET